jgi:hypothetical protein
MRLFHQAKSNEKPVPTMMLEIFLNGEVKWRYGFIASPKLVECKTKSLRDFENDGSHNKLVEIFMR